LVLKKLLHPNRSRRKSKANGWPLSSKEGISIINFVGPMLAEVAMQFTSFEYFWLACASG
jgi:hypothetical protein